MSGTATLAALGVPGLSLALSGVALLVARRVAVAAVLLTAAGAGLVAGASLLANDRAADGTRLALTGGLLLFPLALATYPVPRWRHPVDFLCLVALGSAGVLAAVGNDTEFASATGLVTGLVLVGHTWWRIEHGRGQERRALLWMALAVGSSSLIAGFATFASASWVSLLWVSFPFALVGPALYVGVSMPDVVDVRALVVRAVVFAVAVITYLSVFVLLTGVVQSFGAGDLSLGTTGLLAAIVAMTFHPVQVVLRGVVDELLFGARPDPLDAAWVVADKIGDDPLRALQAIREALVLPYAVLRVDGTDLAVSGIETTHTRILDLDGAGELVVGLRAGDLTFSTGDEHVLRLTVPLLAQTLRARALASQLVESRGQAVAAIEEERRRLRRDLHDGLGPRLSGIAFTSDAARNVLRRDPDQADALLVTLRADAVSAIEEIRQLVYGMRPPALDELGLVPALRQQSVGLRTRDGAPLRVSVRADELPVLPAAVEVAAYRIVVESLSNVARHTASATAAVHLRAVNTGLAIEVADLGGPGLGWSAGVGLSSMRERAAEVGGTLVAGPSDVGGRVEAFLPC